MGGVSGTYRAAVLVGHQAFDLRTLAVPALESDDVLVKVQAVNVCPTDIKKWKDASLDELLRATPLILGHEIAGEVVAVGPSANGVRVGDRVAVDPVIRDLGADGRETLRGIGSAAGPAKVNAELLRDRGIGGGFAEMVKVPAGNVIPLPDDLSYAAGSLVEPLADVVYSVAEAMPVRNRRCGVFGLGPMGLLHVEVLRHEGGRVVAIDPRVDRRENALGFGADEAVAPGDVGPLDCAFIVAGGAALADACEEALTTLEGNGRLVIFASGTPDAALSIDLNRLHYKRQTIVGVVGFRKEDAARAIVLLQAGAIDVERIRQPRISLEEIGRGFADTGKPDTFKFAIDFSPESSP